MRAVLPTPVGPRNMKEPMGRRGSFSPARPRRTAFAIVLIASSCPMMVLFISSSICSSRSDSSVASCITGTPVHMETSSAMSSALTTGLVARSQPVRSFSMRVFRSLSRLESSITSSLRPFCTASVRIALTPFSSSINSLKVCAAGLLYMRTREDASSIRSIALSGRKRSVT